MTNLQSLLTDEGSLESQSAVLNGWYVKIVEFGVSESLGTYDTTRNMSNINTMFANLPISGSQPINNQTRQLNMSIPPNVIDPLGIISTTNKNINEVYLFAEGNGFLFTVDLINNELIVDSDFYLQTSTGKEIRFNAGESSTLPTSTPTTLVINKTFYVIKTGVDRIQIALSKTNALANIPLTLTSTGTGTLKVSKYYLYALGQFVPTPLLYTYTGETKLRGQLTITNLNTFVLNFTYTQSFEIEDHNINPNAHTDIQRALNYNGVYVNDIDFIYKGQNYIKSAVFHSSVVENDLVYLNSNGKWYPSLGTTGDISKWRGIAKLTELKVILDGVIDVGFSITRGDDCYLSDTLAGKITSSVTSFKIGYSLGGGILSLGSQSGGTGSINVLNDLVDVVTTSPQTNDVLMVNPSGANNNFVNAPFLLQYCGDVGTLTAVNKDVLFHNGAQWLNKRLELNDLSDTVIGLTPTGKYLRHNGTSFVDSDLQIPVNDTSNSYSTIKAFSFGTGFVVTQSLNVATINFAGSGGGLSAVVDDLSPQLGGNLDVYGGNTQIRALISYTTLTNQPIGTTFTDNNSSVNFLGIPTIDNTSYLKITINSVVSIINIASVIDAHNLLLNNIIPAILTTDTVSYEIIKPNVFKITNSNPVNSNNVVEIDNLKATLGNSLFTNGNGIFTGGGFNLTVNSSQALNLESGIQGSNIISSGDITLDSYSINKKVSVNKYQFFNGSNFNVNFPIVTSPPSTNQALAVSSISGSDIQLDFVTVGGNHVVQNATNNNQMPLVLNSGSGTTNIRGLRKSENIDFNYFDSSGSITPLLVNAYDIQLIGKMKLLQGNYGSASITTAFQKSSDTSSIYNKGIRGAGTVTVTEETAIDGSGRKNIIITGTGGSGGGSSGVVVGSTNNASGGTGIIINNASSAFKAETSTFGFHANNNQYGNYISNSTNSGIRLDNNEVGITAHADNTAQLLLPPKFSFSNSSQALSSAPATGEINVIASGQLVSNVQTVGSGIRNNLFGVFIYNGSFWQQLVMGAEFRDYP
jgi:hypothetical protein